MTTPPSADPTGHGAGGIGTLTVLYDAGCPVCRTARRWLAAQAQLVPLEFVAAGSAEARRRFPGLDHGATLRDITVVADTGAVYTGDGAWLACLWALHGYRATAETLARPRLRPVARRIVTAASALREATRDAGYGGDDDRRDCADDRCG
ncbi:DCC1-like thiol-disulfide oxidoreductase family protein [Micromonospora sp. NPDC049559]|uniref:thiol-disulfide oxidoreductase DCC family protein n=1 Tax=Micromonospora sp. NPDC049559 TaxID=3155923 RepID=UPI00342CF9CE